MVGTLGGCCECATSGHAVAAPPMSVMNSRRKCHKRAASHARAQAARAQKSIETVSQTERCNITGGEPAAALALRT
jgi:hypothetical protein